MLNLNKDQITKLFNLIGQDVPENPTSEQITGILTELEKKISDECIKVKTPTEFLNTPGILIADDRELSVYQLKKLLTGCGYNTTVARSFEEAVDNYKKLSFQYVIADLFLPNPEDGLNLIDFINNSEKAKKDGTKIIVISGSEDNELINMCFLKGAEEFISKAPDWHKKILKHIGKLEIQKYGAMPEVFTKIEDPEKKIASVTLSNLYKSEVLDVFKREIQVLVNTSYVNVILNLEKVKNIEADGLNAIVYAYKSCSENDGTLKLCGICNAVNDSLSYVFLNNLITVFKDTDAALFDYKKEESLNSRN